jgi:hypothetical protein
MLHREGILVCDYPGFALLNVHGGYRYLGIVHAGVDTGDHCTNFLIKWKVFNLFIIEKGTLLFKLWVTVCSARCFYAI